MARFNCPMVRIDHPKSAKIAGFGKVRAVALGVVALIAVSCQSPPYAAASGHPLTEESTHYKAVLDASDQARIETGFGGLARGHHAVDPPVPAPLGVRWADVPQAVRFACDDAEMAVVQTIDHDGTFEFRLLTIEEYPGRLVVHQTNDDQVYNAEASIGIYGDHGDRARRLLDAFDHQMRAFGKKRELMP